MLKLVLFAALLTTTPLHAQSGLAPANQVWAGPTSGSPQFPGFRPLVSADIPGGGGGGGGVGGPVSSAVGDIALWNNTAGTLLKDITGFSVTAGGPLNLNPTTGTTNQGFAVNQTGPTSGTFTGFNPFNSIVISADALGAGSPNYVDMGLLMQMHTGGTNEAGSKSAIYIEMFHDTATPANANKGDHVAGSFIMQSTVNDGGTDTGVGARGTIFAFNPAVFALSGSTNLFEVAGAEVDVGIFTGASAKLRFGINVVDNGNLNAASQDAAFAVGNAGGPGWITALLLTSANGSAPLSTGGCIICTDGIAHTITTGIDISPYTLTGNFIVGPAANFFVNGTGDTHAHSLSLTNPLAVSQGGTNYTGGAWTAYTATVVPNAGSITTQVSNSSYLQIGKIVHLNVKMTVSNIGTGTVPVTFNIPVAPRIDTICTGREDGISGKMISSLLVATATTGAGLFNYDNTNVAFANGAIYAMTCSYEAL